jgi:hypothetical protein
MTRLWLAAGMVCVAAACGSSSSKGGDAGNGGTDSGVNPDGGAGCDVADEVSAAISSGSPAFISASSADGVFFVGGDELSFDGTSTVTGIATVSGNTFQIAPVGAVCGLSAITSVPSTGFASSLTVQAGKGYVGQFHDGSYMRFFVQSISAGTLNILYEFPALIGCPTGHQVLYQGGCVLELDGKAEKDVGMSGSGGCAFPFVGCQGNASVEVWGSGGSGGGICIAFNGGSGGGGGGGGGYGKEAVALVAGQFYEVLAGSPGEPTGQGFSSCPAQGFAGGGGFPSAFGVEDGGTLVSASGGAGGTGGAASGGTGGAGGASGAAVNAAGVPGANGASNNGMTLCGGAGSAGPGGAGGSAGNGDGGASGGCNPGTAGVPGGGGAGGSQGGSPTPGGAGQVLITF